MLLARVARAARAFATARDLPFLSDAIAKAAIGKDLEVASSFVSAFAPVVHRQAVRVSDVKSLPETTGVTLVRDMKHGIALRYSIGGLGTAVMEVVPQHYNRALVEIQRQPEKYLPGRALAHASGHYLAAINEEAKVVKAEKRRAVEVEEEAKRAANKGGAAGGGPQARRKSPSKEPRVNYDSAVYTAYVRVEPVHLLMLSNFCYAYDTAKKVWRAPKSVSILEGGKYGWASPLFSTFSLATDAGNVQNDYGTQDPGPSTFASTLRDRLSITIVHLPMVPLALDNVAAWNKVVTLPEHQEALESAELRQWLHYLAHTSLKDGKVQMPAELQTLRIFRKSAEMAEVLMQTSAPSYSEKEMADLELFLERQADKAAGKERALQAAALEQVRASAAAALEQERALAAEREAALLSSAAASAAALEQERALAAKREAALRSSAAEREAALERERASAAAALKQERASAAAALKQEQSSAAEREAALRAELERQKGAVSGTPKAGSVCPPFLSGKLSGTPVGKLKHHLSFV